MLIIAGALNFASGFILSVIMCRAMNRSFTNVLFGAFGQCRQSRRRKLEASRARCDPEEAAAILDGVRRVIVIPGYGLAVAQAQHKLREMYDILTRLAWMCDSRFILSQGACRAT